MPNKPISQQLQFANLFAQYVNLDTAKIHHQGFSDDITELRRMDDVTASTYEVHSIIDDTVNATENPSPLSTLMMKYKLPRLMEGFVYHFIKHNEIDFSKLDYGIYLVNDEEMLASGGSDNLHFNYQNYVESTLNTEYIKVTLAIPVNATNTQITKTISGQKDFIKDMQKVANNGIALKRIRPYSTAERDNLIIKLSTNMKPSDVEMELYKSYDIVISSVDISNVLYRHKLRNNP